MNKSFWLFILIASLLLASCAGGDTIADTASAPAMAESVNADPDGANSNAETVLTEPETTDPDEAPAASVIAPTKAAPSDPATELGAISTLTMAYDDALSLEGQLALGTMALEETALPVDETQAAALLPLWQAFGTLTSSGTAAQVELDAVAAQIAQTMTAAQIAAISDMQLTNQIMAERIAQGGLSVGRGLGVGPGTAAGSGGGPVSGIPGSGAGGGMGRGLGGGQPGAAADMDADAAATRQAERESDAFQEQVLTFAVIRLLQAKSGETAQSGLIAETVIAVIASETGLDAAAIQEQLAAGTTVAEIIQDASGNVDDARLALLAALNQLDNAAELDVQSIVDRWLGQ